MINNPLKIHNITKLQNSALNTDNIGAIMKKLLMFFLLGQLLLLSFIFNQSIYAIYELNSLGDSTLTSYSSSDASGDTLNKLYDQINESCLEKKECSLQVIKTPVSEDGTIIYDIYHSDIESINKVKAISSKKVFNYYPLEKVDFVDNDGVFYSDISRERMNKIENDLGISIEPHNHLIDYKQIITYNLLNFLILLIISQLVLFIYTFTRIKVNTVKKVLGFTPAKMVSDSLGHFLIIEFSVAIITVLVHFVYYYYINLIVFRYFLLLGIFIVIVIAINVFMLLLTQISLKYIDINLMIKNKTYSNRLNYSLYIIKIILILTITVSMSNFIKNYQDYLEKTENLEVYEKLSDYYTSIGYNAIQYEVANNNPEILERYGDSIKNLYQNFDRKGNLLRLDIQNSISSATSLQMDNFHNNFDRNYIVVNRNYLEKFDETHGINLDTVDFDSDTPLILVPDKYKNSESEIHDTYIEKYNRFLTYNSLYDLPSHNKPINKVDILYIKNNIEYELLGKNVTSFGEVKVKDPVVIIDNGTFDSLYYYDQLNLGNIIFQLGDRYEFSKIIRDYGLSELVIVGTLITPFLDSIHNTEFIMYNSLVFTILFLFTLLFIIYISNYVDIASNNKKYCILYVTGHNTFSIFNSQTLLLVSLLSATIISLFIEFNIIVYVLVLVADLLTLLILYNKVIKKDTHSILKGG